MRFVVCNHLRRPRFDQMSAEEGGGEEGAADNNDGGPGLEQVGEKLRSMAQAQAPSCGKCPLSPCS